MKIKGILEKLPIPIKFTTDVIWNIFSYATMAVCGVVLNILIAIYYGSAALGVFYQAYAIYIFLSQFAAGGAQLSVLKNVSQFSKDGAESNTIINAGLFLTASVAAVVALVAFLLKDVVANVLNSPDMATAVICLSWGLFFFALNKVWLAFHNGCRRMKAFAVFQSLRYIFMLAFLGVFILLSVEGNKLAAIFSLAELTLFLIVSVYSFRYFRLEISRKVFRWIKQHVVFGSKAVVGNILDEANTRVDVIMLGIFASDAVVGIYSFAAMLAEGFSQLSTVLKVNVNPILTRYKFEEGNEALGKLVRRGRDMFYKLMIPLGVIAIFCFPLAMHILGLRAEFPASWGIFAILVSGYLISVGYTPFKMILNQTGFPGYQTLFLFAIFMTNVILNLILIPILGMHGAAIATAISFIMAVVFLKILVKRQLQISI
jgi:O-antigen/teichoic acid export membrane protein